ncbi:MULTISPECIES: hypothetical protein [Aquimarina]|uniref:hypothetical protein n=1 Tax=Aquimarina TaxID=290174 RepID=UPI000D69F143|nr:MULTISPECIES: hypothetical protein [Aquimarina]
MDQEFSGILTLIRGGIIIFPQLFILIISIYYLIKSGSIDAILMSIGSIINLICSTLFAIDLYAYLGDYGSSADMLYYAIDIFLCIGFIIFGIGLISLINKKMKK